MQTGFAEMLDYARSEVGPQLQALSIHDRANLLKRFGAASTG